jgi:hypothetical protein
VEQNREGPFHANLHHDGSSELFVDSYDMHVHTFSADIGGSNPIDK